MKLYNPRYNYFKLTVLLSILMFFGRVEKTYAQEEVNGVLNTYYKGIGKISSSTTTFSLGEKRNSGANSIEIGDLILFIQMQGAEINQTNDNSYGDGVNKTTGCLDANETPSGNYGQPSFAGGYKSSVAGVYEFCEVKSIVGNIFELKNSLRNTYETSTDGKKRYQIVRVPVYSSIKLVGNIIAESWNGHTGGIVAIKATGDINFNKYQVRGAEIGFRGGVDCSDNQVTSHYDFFSTSAEVGGKGEGIAGAPKKVWYNNAIYSDSPEKSALEGKDFGRGAPANAGGGGNGENAGGGGGANGGFGGAGGGAWNGVVNNGGFGGAPFLETASNRMILGGAGGAGEGNNIAANSGKALHGGNGGGIVIIHSQSVSGQGEINVNGGSADISKQDGAGGGGAGGSILINIETGNLSDLTINANGGNGGENSGEASGKYEHGDGGGGGGGVVFTQRRGVNENLNATINLNGGKGGKARKDPKLPEHTDGSDGGIGVFNVSPPKVEEPAICGNMPKLSNVLKGINSSSYTFTPEDFNSHVAPNDHYTDIKIVTIPSKGELWFNGVKKTNPFQLPKENINLLVFKKGSTWDENSEAVFKWDVKYYKYTEETSNIIITNQPQVTSIKRKEPLGNLTNQNSLKFVITFNKNVVNFDKNDLQLIGGGNATISSVNVNSANSKEYVVSVTNVDASGDVKVNFKSSDHVDIKDARDLKVTIPSSLPTEYYTVDKDAPALPTVKEQVLTNETGTIEGTFDYAETKTLRITFNENTYEYIKEGVSDPKLKITADGKWVLSVNNLSNATHDIVVTAADEVGNRSQDATSNEIQIALKEFDCQSGFYQVVKEDSNISYLKIYDPKSQSYSNVKESGDDFGTDKKINATGFNRADGKIYGLMNDAGVYHLISYDVKGNVHKEAELTGFSDWCNSGDFGSSTELYIMPSSGVNMYKVNIKSHTIEPITLTKDFNRADISYSPSKNLFYTVINNEAVLATISLDGQVTRIGEIDGLPSSGYGAQWITKEGYYFVFDNQGKTLDGNTYPETETYIYKIDLNRKKVVGKYLASKNNQNDGAGCPDMYAPFDTDRDKKLDYIDQDADGDGISNQIENDGVDPYSEDQNSGTFLDSDHDGIPNYLDLDSDNDGIPDNIEAQATSTYQKPVDEVNENGFNNSYPTGLNPVDTDGDHTPDYLDDDSDNDGILDKDESHKNYTNTGKVGVDDDKDGINNEYDNNHLVYGASNQNIEDVTALHNKYMSNKNELYFRNVNNKPPVANPISITFLEDKERFLKDDFKYEDPDGDEFSKVTIYSVSDGVLFLDQNNNLKFDEGEAKLVTKEHPVTIEKTDLSKLGFISEVNENGNNYSTITYKVYDGNAYSFSEYKLVVNITPVDDKPDVNIKNTLSSLKISETNGFVALASHIEIIDPEDDRLRVTVKVTKGNIRLGASGTLLKQISFEGKKSVIDSKLSDLQFIPEKSHVNYEVNLSVLVEETEDAAKSDSENAKFTVECTDDSPVLNSFIPTNKVIKEINEDQKYRFNYSEILSTVNYDQIDDPITKIIIKSVTNGSLSKSDATVTASSDLEFIPTLNFAGNADVKFVVTDAAGNESNPLTGKISIKRLGVGTIKAVDGISISENIDINASIGITAVATDGDEDKVTYQLVTNPGGWFGIDSESGKITVIKSVDYEDDSVLDVDHKLRVKVKAVSEDGTSSEQTFTISVSNADGSIAGSGDKDHSVGEVSDTNTDANTVNENASSGSLVGVTSFAQDEDGDLISYSIKETVPFTIHSGSGVVSVSGNLDYETKKSYDITVVARSTDNSTSEKVFTILVSNADGSIAGSGDKDHSVGEVSDTNADANTVSENASSGSLVGVTAFAQDEDGDLVSYSIKETVPFTIHSGSGVVSVSGNLDYETKKSYDITVVARSTDNSTSEKVFTISVSNANGSIAGSGDKDHSVGEVSDTNTDANTVNENASSGSLVGVTAFAEDADGDLVSYSIKEIVPFTIHSGSGVVSVSGNLDYETKKSYDITVVARSTDNSTSEKVFTISVSNANGSIAGSGDKDRSVGEVSDTNTDANTVSENALPGSLVGVTAFAQDEDGDLISYSIKETVPFTIHSGSGVVSVSGNLDYETKKSYDITVVARSTDNSTSEKVFTISVSNANGSIAGSGDKDRSVGEVNDTNANANTVSENASSGSLVGVTAFAQDEDGDLVSYSIKETVPFTIHSGSGVVSVSGNLDYETKKSYDITVVARSTDNSTSEKVFTISVSNANGSIAGSGDKDRSVGEVNDTNANANIVSENALPGSLVGVTAFAQDEDGDLISYSIKETVPFTIHSGSGVVSVSGNLDYETKKSYDITVVARSTDNSTSEKVFTILVSNADGSIAGSGDKDHSVGEVNDTNAEANTVSENASSGSLVGVTAFAQDEDGDLISYELTNNAEGKFSINNKTGVISTVVELDYEKTKSYTISVKATSTDESFSLKDFTIQVLNVNEAPLALPDKAQVLEGKTLKGECLMKNDSDIDGDKLHVNKTPKENVKHGKLTIHDDGTYTYIPEQYFNGKDYFIYELIDEGTPHKCCFARVDITVTAVNNKPVAGNDVGTVNEDGLLSGINLLANDSDIETGVKIKTKPVKDVEHGTLKIFENGTFTYKPDENFYGTDEFIYEISDIGEPVLYATAKVTIQVLPVNDQPIAYSTEITVKENSTENRIEIDNPSDIDGDELSITIISVVEYGKVLLPNGTVLDQGMKISTDELVNLSYTTQEKTVGEVQFKYEVSDKASEVSQGVVKITIEPADVFIPEAITPNGDGFNDKFVIIGLENYPENSLRIFNRWGNLVYRKSNYDNSWEGYGNVRGQLSNDRLPPGTYYYHFKADKASIRKSGYIYLTY